jgi:putative ABC transport system substrate-binding protein
MKECMQRRAFITVLGGAAAAWPLSVRAQERVRRIGVLLVHAEGDAVGKVRVAAFRHGLEKLGWVEGRNLHVDYRWDSGEPEHAEKFAKELVALGPDAILAHGTPATAALRKATGSIPIVFVTVTDPVGGGYVPSLARPSGNTTGFSTFEPEIGGKWLELLKEISPGLQRVAGILDPDFPAFARLWRAVESMAPTFGLKTATIILRDHGDDIESGVAAFAQQPGGGLISLPTAINNMQRSRIFALAARHRLPAIYPFTSYAADGGLMSYGFDVVDQFRRAAGYIDRVLKGEQPADLPVQAPVKFELAINLKTAKAIGLTVPPTLLARADEVIE